MLRFIDFVPRLLKCPRMGLSATALQGEYEPLEATLAAANQWIASAGVRVVSVETVVLPNLEARYELGSTDPVLGSSSRSGLWHQFIRVWYEGDPVPDNRADV